MLTGIAWLPLLMLSVLEGHLISETIAVPFLEDIEAHVRLLVALPLLVVAEVVIHQRMRLVVGQFRERRLVPEAQSGRFDAAIAAALRLRNSVTAEVILIGLVYVVGVPFVWRQYAALTTATWYAMPAAGDSTLTLTGWWYCWVSLPVFQFLLLRWYFRILIWARLLWHTSRIELDLVPTHPDRVGGLGFLSNTAHAFIPLVAAHGALLAGMIANRIFHVGNSLLDFKVEIASIVGFLLCIVFCPFLVFSRQLANAKRRGLREYGVLAERYARAFDTKWLRGGAAANEPLLGSSDLQSLADLGNSFEVVREMRMAPVSRDAIIQVAAAILLPVVPLALTLMSLEDLLKRLSGIVF